MNETTGMELKVERVRARVTATRLAQELGVTRQRISAVEALGVVNAELAGRYRDGLESLTSGQQIAAKAAEVA